MGKSDKSKSHLKVQRRYHFIMILAYIMIITIIYINNRIGEIQRYILLFILIGSLVIAIVSYQGFDVRKADLMLSVIIVMILIYTKINIDDVKEYAVLITVSVFMIGLGDVYTIIAVIISLGPSLLNMYENCDMYAVLPLIIILMLQFITYHIPLTGNWELLYWNISFMTKGLIYNMI